MKKRIYCLLICMYFLCLNCAKSEAKAYILMEMDSGRVLLEKNADQRLAIASTTKIMTCLLALENSALTDLVTASKNASGVPGTSIYLSVGETLSMEDMLYGLMLRSGNDAAVAIAEHISGSVLEFSSLMNKRAAELDADANFTTPNGLDEGGDGASARGITLIARQAIKNEAFRRIVSTKKKTIPWSDHEYERALTNKNKLLWDYEGAFGVKTGFTQKAVRCLVFAAEREGMTLVGCVLNCPDWFDEAKRLLDEGFEAYDERVFFEAGEIVKTVYVAGREIPVLCRETVKAPVKVGESVYTEIEFCDLSLPLYKGQTAGRISIIAQGEKIAQFDLACADTQTSPSFASAFRRVIALWTLGS